MSRATPRGAGAKIRTLRVRLGPPARRGGYRVLVGPGLLGRLARDLVHGLAGDSGPLAGRVVIVSDDRVAALYGRRLRTAVERAGGRADLLAFPRGESHKTRETKAKLEDRLARLGFSRDGTIVALGGGVTGDLAGFLAATWNRGVPLVQAPTSIIAMLDAAIGGKVGVDHPRAKNLIGAFHPPRAVYADTDTLATLPPREFLAGLSEAVKCGVIAETSLFERIEAGLEALLEREPAAVLGVVLGAAAVKARIVSLDERETGPRRLLNFGHTLGHAVEAASGYRLRHGEAVAIGMVLESRLAVRLGLLGSADASRIEDLLSRLGLPTLFPAGMSPRAVIGAARLDKKSRGGMMRFVLPEGIGRHVGGAEYSIPVQERDLRRLLAESDH